MSEPANLEERILSQAEALFLRYGVRSVTMDDMAQTLSVSKKTIYQHFKDKDEIVLRVAERVFAKERQLMASIHERGENVIHEMVLISHYIREHIATVNPTAMYDLQKFYKNAWQVFRDFKRDELQFVEDTIRKGMTEGLFRDDINPKVLAILRSETIELSFDQHLFPRDQFDPGEVQIQLFDQFIYGILTEKGRQLFRQYTQKEMLS